MTTISCPHCGAGFPLESVAAFERFTCGACGEEVPVPAAPPLPSVPHAGRGAPRARPAASHGADAEAHPHRRHAARHPAEPRKRSFSVAAVAVAGVLVAGAVAWMVLRDDGGDVPRSDPEGSASASPAALGAARATTSSTDPERDPAAWRALPESDRQARTSTRMMHLDPRDASAGQALHAFFVERGETTAAERVVGVVLGADPNVTWARDALGQADLNQRIDAAVRECPRAELSDTDALLRLRAFRSRNAPAEGAWWGDAETRAKVEALLVELRADEARLRTPFGQAVADWVSYRRSIAGIRDLPAVHGTAGPYLVFVSVPVAEAESAAGAGAAGREAARREATLEDAKPEDVERARAVLERTLKLYSEFHEAWHRELGALLGFERYGPENADRDSLLVVQVFPSWEEYADYSASSDDFDNSRATYCRREPRMITTYDGPLSRRVSAAAQAANKDPGAFAEDTVWIQFHEATQQLLHFSTRDLTRKSAGSRPSWLDCEIRRLWGEEGFAEFFSSSRVVDGVRRWMQPDENRLCTLWMFAALAGERGWADLRLSEVLEPLQIEQVEFLGQTRGTPEEREATSRLLPRLFFARAWSLHSFLWHAEADGRPKYRDAFAGYLKKEFRVELARGRDGLFAGRKRTPAEFREALGLGDDASLAAFEREWREYETKLAAANHGPDWEKRLAAVRTWLPPK